MSKRKRLLSVLLICSIVLGSLPGMGAAAAQGESQESPWVATPYTKEDGTVAQGLEEAVEGKKHWLETTEPMPVEVREEAGSLTVSNGVLERTFHIPDRGDTDFYTTSYQNTYIEKELIKDTCLPDVYLGLYSKPYREVYEGEIIKETPEYYFVGGTGKENTFVFDHYEISQTCEKPFEWERNPLYGDPSSEAWPPKGAHLEFYFTAPDTFPETYRDVRIKVIYEMFDNLAAMKKRVEVINGGDSVITVGRIAPEILDGNQDMEELMSLEYDYTCGADGTVPINEKIPCTCKDAEDGSPFQELDQILHTCYEVGPAYQLDAGQELITFNTYELVYSTYWFELRAKERLGMYRKLFPWITDNPLTMHNTGSLTRSVIDHASESGFEMIIQSYSAPDRTGQMLTRDPQRIREFKDLVDYAHTKNVDIGVYQAQYQLGQYKQSAEYGANGIGKWGTWCFASAAFDDYWDNFKNFVQQTGVDCVEIDGTYPGCSCNNGEKHVNEDRETDPDPEGTDQTTGTPSKYASHYGYYDSQVKQWENAVRMMTATFRNLGVYVKVPAWYYMSGGNKCGIGYEEAAWSQPRQEQLIYGRQLMHNASYARTMSMSWSHVPFVQYHGGGSDAAFTPFKDHKEDYNWALAQYMGNGIASDYRGTSLCDDETLPILQKWVQFYKRYRGIVNSDMVHIRQAMYEDEKKDRSRTTQMDALYHVNANNDGEKGLLWVYNQTDEPRTETITVPMYYTGLTSMNYPQVPLKGSLGKDVHSYGTYPPNYAWLPKEEANYKFASDTGIQTGEAAFVKEGIQVQDLAIDANGNVQLQVTLPPMSFTYYAVYPKGEAPSTELSIGAVKDIRGEAGEHHVDLTWDPQVDMKLTEDGIVNENPSINVEYFNIYRDGTFVGKTLTNAYRDQKLKENTKHSYQVTAVVSGIEGEAGQAAEVTTKIDETAPEVIQVQPVAADQIEITFSEPIDQESAQEEANYQLSGDVSLQSVRMSGEEKVLLEVSPLEALEKYELSIQAISDISAAKNVIVPCTCPLVYGYLAKYEMEELTGGKTPNSVNGEGASVYQASLDKSDFGNGLKFQASKASYADLGSKVLNGLDTYSISMWVSTKENGRQILLSQGQEQVENSDFTLSEENGVISFTASSRDGSRRVTLDADKDLKTGCMNLVTLVRKGDDFTLYLNGAQAAKETAAGIEPLDNQNALLLGAMKNHAGGDRTGFFSGIIDQVAIYQVALTASYVRGRFYQNPTLYADLLESLEEIDGRYYEKVSFQNMLDAKKALEEAIAAENPDGDEMAAYYEALDQAKADMKKKEEYRYLQAYYAMDEDSQELLKESVAGNYGILSNGEYLRIGTPFKKGIYITKVMKDIAEISGSALEDSSVYTVMGWFKSQAFDSDERNAAGRQVLLSDGAQNMVLSLENNRLILELKGRKKITLTSVKDIATMIVTGGEERQAWNHFAVSRNEDRVCLYLNGELAAKETAWGINEGDGILLLGGRRMPDGAVKDSFNGILDEFSIYSTDLPQSVIEAELLKLPFDKGTQENIALKKTLNSDSMEDAFRLNDGKVLDFASPDTPWTARKSTSTYVKYGIDLGAEYRIEKVSLTQFFRDFGNATIRRFKDVVIQVSDTSDFSGEVTTIYNSDADGSVMQGTGSDTNYYSFNLGYDLVLDEPVKGRYVRMFHSGFYNVDGSFEPYCNVSELEVYGHTAKSSKEELKKLAKKAKELDLSSFGGGIEELEASIEEARQIYENENRTYEESWQAIQTLRQAIGNLTVKKDHAEGGELEEAIKKAEEAQKRAEEAQAEAEKARQEALAASQEAENQKQEAEKYKQQAQAAREEALKHKQAAETASQEAKKAEEASIKAKEEAKAAQSEAKKAQEAAEETAKQAGADSEAAKEAHKEAQKKAEEAEAAKKAAALSEEQAKTAKAKAEEAKSASEAAQAAAEAAEKEAEAAKKKALAAMEESRAILEEAKAAQAAAEAKASEAKALAATAKVLLERTEEKMREAEEARKKAEADRIAAEEALERVREAQKKAEEARRAAEKAQKEAGEASKEAGKASEEAAKRPAGKRKPEKVVIKTAKSINKKEIRVTWAKVKGADAYELQYASNPKFKKAVTRKLSNNRTSFRIKKQKSKKYCYIRIRACKNASGGKISGSYSKVKKVKVK